MGNESSILALTDFEVKKVEKTQIATVVHEITHVIKIKQSK